MSSSDELAEHLASDYPDPPPIDTPERDSWQIDGDRQATWALRKLGGYVAEQARLQALADEERQRVEDWLADSTSGLRSQVQFFQDHLVGYLHRLLDENPELPKTYKLPTGKLSRRKGADRIVVDEQEPDRFVEWALANDRRDLLTIRPSASAMKAEIGDWQIPSVELDAKGGTLPSQYGSTHPIVTAEGEIVPGISYEVGSESMSAKPEEAQR